MLFINNVREIEEQRSGRNRNTTINNTYINSGGYRKKFDNISSDESLNRLLFQLAKKMLLHRAGTLYEDMYWVDLETRKIVAEETVCHNGKIYMYSAGEEISQDYYNLTVTEYLKQGYNECEAQVKALDEIKTKFKIKFKEVMDNDV